MTDADDAFSAVDDHFHDRFLYTQETSEVVIKKTYSWMEESPMKNEQNNASVGQIREIRVDMKNVEFSGYGLQFTPQQPIAEAVEITKPHSVKRIQGVKLISRNQIATKRLVDNLGSKVQQCLAKAMSSCVDIKDRESCLLTAASFFFIRVHNFSAYGGMRHGRKFMEAWYSTVDSINKCIELDPISARLRVKDQHLNRNIQAESNISCTRNNLESDQQRSQARTQSNQGKRSLEHQLE
ncbi:hypothetical protein T265_01400 [Opisthorchis viverrini]|uniref:Uncharacterized protein n=1 Tax=Opisthorchis viverrini TaxID=6198 RepID=A0A075A9U2_OPIVI|nr:hypothetical protein T265_01400 [Opisthorchis viverrini]KER32525.1 hypothetical protein T265_01400 [Opisthorchis viverrini]